MDLASAYVLHPLNHLVLNFKVWQRSDERVEVWSILDQRLSEGTERARGGVKMVNLVGDGVANLVGNLGS